MMKIGILGDFIQTPAFRIDPALLDILQKNDFNIANLEAPFIKDSFLPANGKSGLYQKTGNCDLLKKLNIRIVSLANNHIFDFGLDGFRHTKSLLEKSGILYFGAGENRREAEAGVPILHDMQTLSCRGFMCRYLSEQHAGEHQFGTADIQPENIIPLLQQDTADFKLLYHHWNQEYEDYPEPLYKTAAERLIAHCDILAGSHAHCMQGIRTLGGRPIFYGLGNFSLPNIDYYQCHISAYRPKSYMSFFPVLTLDGKTIRYVLIPYLLNPDGSAVLSPDPDKTAAILKKIEDISVPLASGDEAYRKFYRKNRERKMRKALTADHQRNLLNLKRYRRKYQCVVRIERFFAYILDKVRLRKIVRKGFHRIIDRIQKAK